MDLTDEQWALVQPLLTQSKHLEGPGRPPASLRRVLEGVLWKLRTAAAWDDLPPEYPSHQTCYRYNCRWLRSGVMDQVLRSLTGHLKLNGVDLETALFHKDIELVDVRLGTVIHFNPDLQGTWKASTAQLLLQVFYIKARRLGRAKGRLIPTSYEAH